MPIVALLVGLPASGKDTLINSGAFPGYEIISRDDILLGLGSGNYMENFNTIPGKIVDKHFFKMLSGTATSGRNAVVNATHLTLSRRRKVLNRFPGYFKVAVILPLPDFETFCLRNEKRKTEGGKYLPVSVYGQMLSIYDSVNDSEGFDVIKTLSENEKLNLEILIKNINK
jgi:predicted kinase